MALLDNSLLRKHKRGGEGMREVYTRRGTYWIRQDSATVEASK